MRDARFDILFEPVAIGGWIVLALLDWLALFVWATLTLWASAATASTTAAAGLGFVALIAISIAAAIPTLEQWLPAGLAGPAAYLAAGTPVDGAKIATAVVGSVIVAAVATGASIAAFRRREL